VTEMKYGKESCTADERHGCHYFFLLSRLPTFGMIIAFRNDYRRLEIDAVFRGADGLEAADTSHRTFQGR